MRRFRAVVCFVVVEAVALACDDEVNTTLPLNPDLPLTLQATLDHSVLAVSDSVRIQLDIANPGRSFTVQFPSTCQVAFEIRSAAGDVVAPSMLCGLGTTYREFPQGTDTAVFFWYRWPDVGPPLIPPGQYEVVAGLGFPLVAASPPVPLVLP